MNADKIKNGNERKLIACLKPGCAPANLFMDGIKEALQKPFFVIPAEAGIQAKQIVTGLDPRLRGDDFCRAFLILFSAVGVRSACISVHRRLISKQK